MGTERYRKLGTPDSESALLSAYIARKNHLLASILIVGVLACAGGLYTFYALALSQARLQISTIARNYARVLETAASSKTGGLEPILEHSNAYTPAVQTLSGIAVHFDYGKLADNLITVYPEGRPAGSLHFSTESPIAQPMRLALEGRSGTTLADDRKGDRVLAAYEPVPSLGIGLVLKVRLDEIQAPFVMAATVAGPIVLFTVLILQILVLRMANPLIRDLEFAQKHGAFLGDSNTQAVVTINARGDIASVNPRSEAVFASDSYSLEGAHISRLLPAILPGSSSREVVEYLVRHSNELEGRKADGTMVCLRHRETAIGRGAHEGAVLILDHVGRADEIETQNTRVRAQNSFVTQISAEAVVSSEAGVTYKRVAHELVSILGISACALWQAEADGTTMVLRSASDSSFGAVDQRRVPAGVSSQAGYALLKNQSLWVEDYTHENRFAFPDINPESSYVSSLSVIVPGSSKPFGVLSVHTRIKQRFTVDENRLLQSIANLVALAHQRGEAHRQARLYTAAFDHGSDAVALLDVHGTLHAVNSAFEVVTGFSKSEVIGRNLQCLGYNPNEHWLDQAAARSLAEGKAWQGISINRRRDGSILPTLRTVAPIYDASGGFDGYVVVLRPDSERFKIQESVSSRASTTRANGRAQGLRDAATRHAYAAAIKAQPADCRTGSKTRSQETADPGPVRILVAEDNTASQQLAVNQLATLGYEAGVAVNGFEVLEALEQQRFDVVLMDCAMPELDGFEATSEIRRREADGAHTIIIAMTAHNLEGDRERCLNAGMDDYLAKPISTAQLAAMLAQWLPTEIAETLTLGGELRRTRYASSAAADRLEPLLVGSDTADDPVETAGTDPEATGDPLLPRDTATTKPT